MNVSSFFRRVERFTTANSPLLLTGIGAVGVLTTAALSFQAGVKYNQVIDLAMADDFKENGAYRPLEPREKIDLTWRLFIPPIGSAVLTCGAIIGANQIGTRRAAAMAAAYGLSEKAFDEYRAQVRETLGENKERKVRDDVAQTRINNNPPDREIIIGEGEQLCYDAYSGRYFKSDMETLKKAQNDINYRMLHSDYASLTEYYELIGLPRTSISDDVGWNCDQQLEVEYSTCLTPDQKPAISVEFRVDPIRNYFQGHR